MTAQRSHSFDRTDIRRRRSAAFCTIGTDAAATFPDVTCQLLQFLIPARKATVRVGISAMNSSLKILSGVVPGVAFGLFLGERAAVLQVVADIYLKLLQMTVLPYVTVSLVSGLGARRLAPEKVNGVATKRSFDAIGPRVFPLDAADGTHHMNLHRRRSHLQHPTTVCHQFGSQF